MPKIILVSDEECIKRGYNLDRSQNLKFKNKLLKDPNYIVYYHPKYRYWYFFDTYNREMIKVSLPFKASHLDDVKYIKMKERLYSKRESVSMYKTGKEYKYFLYLIFGSPVTYEKYTYIPVIKQEKAMESIQYNLDRLERKKLQDE